MYIVYAYIYNGILYSIYASMATFSRVQTPIIFGSNSTFSLQREITHRTQWTINRYNGQVIAELAIMYKHHYRTKSSYLFH